MGKKLNKYSVIVIESGNYNVEETVIAEKYMVEGAGMTHFYIGEPSSYHGKRIASYPTDRTIIKLEKDNKGDAVVKDDFDELNRNRYRTEGKMIMLEEDVIKVLKYLCFNLNKIAIELNNIGKGKVIYNKYYNIIGFISNLNDDLKIAFNIKDKGKYVADIYFYYKKLCVMSAKLHSKDMHWNGDISSLELFDAYCREGTRHELEKSFQQYLNWITKEIYNPMMEKQNYQTLFKDNLYDEYIESIKSV